MHQPGGMKNPDPDDILPEEEEQERKDVVGPL